MCRVPGPATMLFNRPIQDPLHQMNRAPTNVNKNNAQYEALKAHQNKYVKNNDTHTDTLSFPIQYTATLQYED